jgi:copper chaperone CopZ
MSRLVEGIKELLKGKDEPEYRYRSGYDQRYSQGSTKYYGYPQSSTSEVRSGYQRPYGQALDDYQDGYDRSDRKWRGQSNDSPRGDYRRTAQESPREYRKTFRGSRLGDNDSDEIELMVPMCCDKCKEKVEEELGEVEGVESVECDPMNSRVTVTGSNIDVSRCLVKAERAVKQKCELISNDSDDDVNSKRGSGRRGNLGRYQSRDDSYSGYSVRDERSGTGHYRSDYGSKSGRPSLGRLPSFASGKVTQYDGYGQRGQDYDVKDYTGFRSMPSFNKHRHHEAEFITSYDQRPQYGADTRVAFANVRRMPSFNRHRHHDAEYINDREYSPRTFYENGASAYTTAYNERPVYRSQVSFSRLPVGNPNYVKHIEY